MTARGVHFALSSEDEQRLLAVTSDEELIDFISQDIEERWERPWLVESDKAWEPLHECLKEHAVLRRCFLGGELLADGDDYIVSYLSTGDVKVLDSELQEVDEAALRRRCATDHDIDDVEFEYVRAHFVGVKKFFHLAAEAGRAVIFTVAK